MVNFIKMNSQNKCCFKNKSEKYIAKTGIISSVISILLLLWGIIELKYDTDTIKYFYYISFSLIILCLIGYILILILLSEKINKNKINVNKTINFISSVIFIISLYSFILLIIHFIVEIYDYINAEKILPSKNHIPIKKWVALFIPSLISFICLIFILISSKALYKQQVPKTKKLETTKSEANNQISFDDFEVEQSNMAVIKSLKKSLQNQLDKVNYQMIREKK